MSPTCCYKRPFMTDSLGIDTRSMLRGMLTDLDVMAAVGASDQELEAAE